MIPASKTSDAGLFADHLEPIALNDRYECDAMLCASTAEESGGVFCDRLETVQAVQTP